MLNIGSVTVIVQIDNKTIQFHLLTSSLCENKIQLFSYMLRIMPAFAKICIVVFTILQFSLPKLDTISESEKVG